MFDKRMDIINYSKDILFTNMQRLCIMFAAYELSFIVQNEINENKAVIQINQGLSVTSLDITNITETNIHYQDKTNPENTIQIEKTNLKIPSFTLSSYIS